MSLQLAAANCKDAKRKRQKSGGGDKGNCTQAEKCTAVQVCWQT
jgi:hypothetical protein